MTIHPNPIRKAPWLSVPLAIVAVFTLVSCSLPFGSGQSLDPGLLPDARFTITPQATKTDARQPALQAGVQPITQPGSQPVSSQPTPTQVPPQPPSQPQSQNPLTISITSISNPTGIMHYGTCLAGEPTLLTVQTKVEPVSRVKTVILAFSITDSANIVTVGSVSMVPQVNQYEGTLDMQTDVAAALGGSQDGTLNFWVEAIDQEGKTTYSLIYTSPVQVCLQIAVGQPPVGPAYPLPEIVSFTAPASASPGDTVMFEWNVINAPCGVTFTGLAVEPVSSFVFYDWNSPAGDYPAMLIAYGEPCDNPTIVTETRVVKIAKTNLTVCNASPSSIWYLYISPITANYWGDDQLGANIITTNSCLTFQVDPGIYDLKAEDASHGLIKSEFDIDLNQDTTWNVP